MEEFEEGKELRMEEENFHEGGVGFFSVFWKKQCENKYEKVFSTESKEQH